MGAATAGSPAWGSAPRRRGKASPRRREKGDSHCAARSARYQGGGQAGLARQTPKWAQPLQGALPGEVRRGGGGRPPRGAGRKEIAIALHAAQGTKGGQGRACAADGLSGRGHCGGTLPGEVRRGGGGRPPRGAGRKEIAIALHAAQGTKGGQGRACAADA